MDDLTTEITSKYSKRHDHMSDMDPGHGQRSIISPHCRPHNIKGSSYVAPNIVELNILEECPLNINPPRSRCRQSC